MTHVLCVTKLLKQQIISFVNAHSQKEPGQIFKEKQGYGMFVSQLIPGSGSGSSIGESSQTATNGYETSFGLQHLGESGASVIIASSTTKDSRHPRWRTILSEWRQGGKTTARIERHKSLKH